MKSLVKNNTIPSKVNTLLPLHEGHGQILKYLCSPISLIPRPMHVHTFYGVNHLWAWYICSCACLMLRTSTIYDSSLCANCSGALLCRHACASHILIQFALSEDLPSCCDISWHSIVEAGSTSMLTWALVIQCNLLWVTV